MNDAADITQFQQERQDMLEELRRRCSAARLDSTERIMYDGSPGLAVQFRAGRDVRTVTFAAADDLKVVLQQNFEKYTFLGDYAAICNYENGTIEAGIRFLSGSSYRLFPLQPGAEDEVLSEAPIEVRHPSNGATITLGPASELLAVLSRSTMRGPRTTSVRIGGLAIKNHDEARALLEGLTSALFFQIDLLYGTLPALLKHRPPVRASARPSTPSAPKELEFPKVSFDPAPLSLYSYGRSALGMPLLRFLAYYQAIEFYFPTYSRAEAHRRIRGIIKSPAFRADRDADIGRVLSAVRANGGGFGDERSQLRATVNECIDPDALREFLCQDDERKEFFSSRKANVAKRVLPLKSPDVASLDLRNDVAERIYEIRCKIVHTKSGTSDVEVELLLPFSPEAEALRHDINLVQFVAREVIIAAGSPMAFEAGVPNATQTDEPG